MAAPRSPLARWVTRTLGHRLEAAGVYALYGLFRALPLDAASALGGWIGRTVGPWLPGTRTARRNLARALPAQSTMEREATIRGMWDNLGRVFAEYPHLEQIGRERTEVIGREIFPDLRDDGKAAIFFAGHLANWEVPGVCVHQGGLELALVYRAPNNPYVGRLLVRMRGPATATNIPKGADGARMLARRLTKGGNVGLLVDQKLNDGIPVPFFGRDAMTAPAAAVFALRFGIPLVPVRLERLQGARFRMTVLPPLDLDGGDRTAAPAVMARINTLLESWIRERPEQWLWLHRRWPD